LAAALYCWIRCSIVFFVFVFLCCFFFFFQAEDGIRDKLVTGVQTCALPICCPFGVGLGDGDAVTAGLGVGDALAATFPASGFVRSEERRVGKERRAGGEGDEWKERRER